MKEGFLGALVRRGKWVVVATGFFAIGAGALGFLAGLLHVSGLVLLGGFALVLTHALLVGLHRARQPMEKHGERRRRRMPFGRALSLHLLLGVLYALVLVLMLVELLTLPALAGKLHVFGEFALGSIALYPAAAGILLTLISLAVHLGVEAPASQETSVKHARHEGYLWMGLSILFALATVVTAVGLLEPFGLKSERTVFMLAGGIVPLFFFARTWVRLPTLGEINDWIEREERLKRSGALRGITYGFSGLAVLGTLVAILSNLGLIPRAAGLLALGVAVLALIPATFSVGVTRIIARLEGSGETVEEARKKRRVILNALSISLTGIATALGLVTFFAFLAQVAEVEVFRFLLEAFVAFYPTLLSVALWALVATVLVRTRVGTEVAYSERLRSQTILGTTFALILLFFGLFIGAGFAQGSGIQLENAVLALAGAVLSLIAFVKARALLPSVWGLVREAIKESESADVELAEDIRKKMMITYIGGILFVLGLVAFIAMRSLGVVQVEDSVATETGYFIYILLGLAIFALAVVRSVQARNADPKWRKNEGEIGKRRLTAEELTRNLTLGICGSLALVLLTLGILIKVRIIPSVGGLEVHEKFSTDLFVFALLLGLGPYGYFYNREQKRIAAINAKFPEFIRDLAESQRAGMTLTEAVITASKGDYGALTPEIRKMAVQIEWGVSFSDALKRFSKRVRTPLIGRATSLIIQAANAGGNVVDVLSAAADDARDIQMILKERKSSMSIYVMIIYVAFFVFLGVITVLNTQFIPEVSKAVAKADGASLAGMTFRKFDEQIFKSLFFHAAIIQSMGGGLVAGVMEGGRPQMGLKHAQIMLVISYVVFRFFIGG